MPVVLGLTLAGDHGLEASRPRTTEKVNADIKTYSATQAFKGPFCTADAFSSLKKQNCDSETHECLGPHAHINEVLVLATIYNYSLSHVWKCCSESTFIYYWLKVMEGITVNSEILPSILTQMEYSECI